MKPMPVKMKKSPRPGGDFENTILALLALPSMMVEDADLPAQCRHFVEKIRRNALDLVPPAQKPLERGFVSSQLRRYLISLESLTVPAVYARCISPSPGS
jgi:hypothetical protein